MSHFLTEEQLNVALTSPRECANLIKMLSEDMAMVIAIVSGPEATGEKHKRLVQRIALDLIAGAAVCHTRLREMGAEAIAAEGRIILPH